MSETVQTALLEALSGPSSGEGLSLDMGNLSEQLQDVAYQALQARAEGIPIYEAVYQEAFPELGAFHLAMRDALFVEVPAPMRDWIEGIREDEAQEASTVSAPPPDTVLRDPDLSEVSGQSEADPETSPLRLEQLLLLHALAGRNDPETSPQTLQSALAELLLFESVRLRLLIAAWSNEDFERLGGDERDIDRIAGQEVSAMLEHPDISDPELRPTALMLAAAAIQLQRDAERRATALRHVGDDEIETLNMRARLRQAIRGLRLTESVLLENALAQLLGTDRVELVTLQQQRPLALEGMSRQAMDQRVSRSRRALAGDREKWPERRKPALFDLFSQNTTTARDLRNPSPKGKA